MSVRTVMVFGTFDGIHEGHIHFFREARKYGNRLVAVVALDRTVREVKGRMPLRPQEQRLKEVSSLPEVDEAVLGCEDDKFRVIEEFRPDVICLGHDQHAFADELPGQLAKRGIRAKIVRGGPFRREIYRSSIINRLRASEGL